MVNEIFPTCHDCPYYQERSLRSPPPTKKKKKKDRPPTNLVQSLPHLKSPTGDIKINKQQSRKHRQRHTTILTKKKKTDAHNTRKMGHGIIIQRPNKSNMSSFLSFSRSENETTSLRRMRTQQGKGDNSFSLIKSSLLFAART